MVPQKLLGVLGGNAGSDVVRPAVWPEGPAMATRPLLFRAASSESPRRHPPTAEGSLGSSFGQRHDLCRAHLSRVEGLPDLLAWFTLVAPGVVLNKNGSLLAGWTYSGPDLDSSTDEELGSQAEILNRALLALGDGWGLHAEALRLHAPAYPKEGAFPDPVTRLLDEERRSLYEARPLFETRLFLTVTYAPPPRGSS